MRKEMSLWRGASRIVLLVQVALWWHAGWPWEFALAAFLTEALYVWFRLIVANEVNNIAAEIDKLDKP